MIVVCINNKNQEARLTINKQYNITKKDFDDPKLATYWITNDSNIYSWYNKNRFITIEEHRNNIINNIIE